MIDKQEVLFFQNNGFFPQPHLLQIEITNRCSLSCPQCYKERLNERDMDISLFKKVMVDASRLKIGTLMLNGGEPFEHKHIMELLRILEGFRFQIHCFSSGLGLTDDIIEFLSRTTLDFKLSISLNGSNEEINSLSRDGYKIAVNAIKRLVDTGIPIGIHWVCRHDNLHDFPNLVHWAKENGVQRVTIAANKLSGFGKISSQLETEDYKFLLDYLEHEAAIDPKYIRVQYCYSLLNALRKSGINRHIDGCAAGVHSCNIDVNGAFRPCTHLYYPERFDSIEEYWNNSYVLKELRKSRVEKKKCHNCSKKVPCYFCKAMFENTVNDFYKEPEYCPLMQLYEM